MFTPNHMNILFIGKACPLKTAEIILQKSGKNPGYQIIKFTDLILKGFIHNQQKVSVLTNISNPNNVFSFSKRETKDDIYYKYLPSIRIPILSQLLHIIYNEEISNGCLSPRSCVGGMLYFTRRYVAHCS